MSLLSRKRAKNATKAADLSTLTWASMTSGIAGVEALVGTNAQLRYGIATETDVGLPAQKYVIIPTLEDISDAAGLQRMYDAVDVMSGIHTVLQKDGTALRYPLPDNAALAGIGALEWENRTKTENILVDDSIDPDHNLYARPQPEAAGVLTAICAHMNFLQFKAAYPDINEGAVIAGAHAVAMAYRTGIIETYANREYIFATVLPGERGSYRIIRLDPKYHTRDVHPLTNGQAFPEGTLQLHPKLTELGLGLCIGAGTTHYMMNHSTGGQVLNGHNLKALTVNSLYEIDPGHGRPSEVNQTDFIYNVVHPVNKRAVANLVLRGSLVNSWYRNPYMLPPTVMYSDTFMAYRQNLVPSGAHKIYIAALVLRDIITANLGIFLPDQDLCKRVIKMYSDVTTLGAKAHVGARYYTDKPPVLSQGEVDSFLPLAAYYVHHKMQNSSIASSPHITLELADAAAGTWKAVVDATIRMGAAAAPADQIAAYLKLSNAAGYTVDLSTDEGIRDAVRINSDLGKELEALF